MTRARIGGTEGLAAGRGRGATAFTLLELLVVVTILAILMTMLVPILGSAKDRARLTVCMTNQSSIMDALGMYLGQNGNRFPYNYADYGRYRGDPRWALDAISPMLNGIDGPAGRLHGRSRLEGEFPRAYICPSADLDEVYSSNPSDNYHACYWTSIAIRLNRGYGPLFHDGRPPDIPGNDGDSRQAARITGACPRCRNWRSVYFPTIDSVSDTAGFVFSGDSTNAPFVYHRGNRYEAAAGDYWTRPGTYPTFGAYCGFDRHAGELTLSYLDGHSDKISFEYVIDNYSHWVSDEGMFITTGAWLVKFPNSDVCIDIPDDGSSIPRHHPLAEPVVE